MKYINERTYIVYCMALLAVLFLSSAVPAATVEAPNGAVSCADNSRCADNNPFSGASSFVVELDKEFPTVAQPPVEYTDFDISVYLSGWYTMYVYQLKLEEILDDEEFRLEAQKRAKAYKEAWSGWDFLIGVLVFWVLVNALVAYLMHRKGKRV